MLIRLSEGRRSVVVLSLRVGSFGIVADAFIAIGLSVGPQPGDLEMRWCEIIPMPCKHSKQPGESRVVAG